jgi:hypothetical protein
MRDEIRELSRPFLAASRRARSTSCCSDLSLVRGILRAASTAGGCRPVAVIGRFVLGTAWLITRQTTPPIRWSRLAASSLAPTKSPAALAVAI